MSVRKSISRKRKGESEPTTFPVVGSTNSTLINNHEQTKNISKIMIESAILLFLTILIVQMTFPSELLVVAFLCDILSAIRIMRASLNHKEEEQKGKLKNQSMIIK